MENHQGVWTGVFLQGKISDHWGWSFENQLRLHRGWDFNGGQPNPLETRANRLLVRPSIRWMPRGDSSLQFALGWGWTPNLSPERDEHRLWEQVLFQGGDANEGIEWQHRFRLEQRHIEFTGGLHHRIRYLGRLTRFLGETKTYGLTAWTEIFWNLNSIARGPKEGLDQTRVFFGPVVKISHSYRLEMGYLNVYYPKGAAKDSLMSHILATNVTLDLPI
jgi:hypothetical protein